MIDFDGPINDVNNRYYMVHQKVCEILNFKSTLSNSEYWNLKVNFPQIFFYKIKLPVNKINDYKYNWNCLIEDDYYLSYDKIHPFARLDLIELANIYSLWLVSLRKNFIEARNTLDRYGISNIFQNIFFLKHENNNSEVKYNAIKSHSWPAGNFICFIGDTEIDVYAAEKLEITSYSVTSGIRSEKFLKSMSYTKVFDTLTDVKYELFKK